MQVSLVPSEAVLEMWPKVRPFMQKAIEYADGRFEVDDLLVLLTEDLGFSLWIAFEDMDVYGAVITGYRQYPRKKYLDIAFVGGETNKGVYWKEPMVELLRKWAKDNNCDGIETAGRAGWERYLGVDGTKTLWSSFEIPLLADTIDA